jgi:hypothetical protein
MGKVENVNQLGIIRFRIKVTFKIGRGHMWGDLPISSPQCPLAGGQTSSHEVDRRALSYSSTTLIESTSSSENSTLSPLPKVIE